MNTRDQLLAKLTLPVEPVEVDGMTIYLRDVSYGTQLKIADMRLAEQEKISPAMIAEFQRLTISTASATNMEIPCCRRKTGKQSSAQTAN